LKGQPPFLNAVCTIYPNSGHPVEFLELLTAIEKATGRKSDRERWSQRPLDLDILFWGEEIIDLNKLKVPHPLIADRRFVLQPLAEISPELLHPVLNQTIADLLKLCPDQSKVARISGLKLKAP
jgi:2-amino-4-hydroxy-6-hydroxymethyldihydropteridine diphosphokinase